MNCKCGHPADKGKAKCRSCQRLGETKKRNMTDGERDCVDFMSRCAGFRMKVAHPDYYSKEMA